MADSPPHNAPLRGLVLAKYGDLAASTRQRFVQAAPYLAAQSITLEIAPLFRNDYLAAFFRDGTRRPADIASAYLRRLGQVWRARAYDFVIVQYELFPYLPGLFEQLIRLTSIPVFVDMDDAMFHQYDLHPNPLVRGLLEGKMLPLLKHCRIAFCGNEYLAAYARPHAPRVEILPTTVDVSLYQPVDKPPSSPPVLGWIGSPTTWRYCAPWHAMLAEYAASGKATLRVVGAGNEATPKPGITFKPWVEAEEIGDIQTMDIGIMPIPDEPWARGKCGYKLIQYMACGLPVIGSDVGANRAIITHGENGFLASTEAQWREAIDQLLADASLRQRMGEHGRKTVEARYSIQTYGPQMAALIRGAID